MNPGTAVWSADSSTAGDLRGNRVVIAEGDSVLLLRASAILR